MKPAGPFVPTTAAPMRISMAGDDCSLHFSLDALTEKQRADHRSNQVLTAMLQIALLYIGKREDEVCLYEEFRKPPWAAAVQAYRDMFQRLGLDPVPSEQVRYHPVEGFYESVAAAPSRTELETLYMVSGSNYPLHRDENALRVSRNLNSKVHFAEHASAFGLPVPETLHCRKAELGSERVAAFVARVGRPLMLKTLGLAGARNVTTINDVGEAQAYVAEYGDDMDVILQQRLDPDRYTEMTVDLLVSDTDIHVTNVRRILFADGLWVGNLLGPSVTLPAGHERTLLRVGEYARQHGFTSPQGYNLGIDYFVANDRAPADAPELVVTEINARWTGGLFPTELMRRLRITDRDAVAFFDMCPPERFDDYVDFLQRHLVTAGGSFGIAPIGFTPFSTEIEGRDQLFVWQIVIGDFDAFKVQRQAELGDEVLITAPIISTGLSA